MTTESDLPDDPEAQIALYNAGVVGCQSAILLGVANLLMQHPYLIDLFTQQLA